jgi:hypothetical protein
MFSIFRSQRTSDSGPRLERDIVVMFLWSGVIIRQGILCRFLVAVRCACRGHKLAVLNRDSVFAALGAVLGRPGIERQPAFDKHKLAFGQIFIHIFRLPSERPTVNEAGLFPLAAVLGRPPAVRCQAEIDYGSLIRRIGQLRVPGQITHQQNFVKIGHN